MTENLLGITRWKGSTTGDVPGCYVHYLPTHGPNIYANTAHKRDPKAFAEMDGIIYPQWGIGFPHPFEEKIGVEFKDDFVVAIHGKSREAEHLREYMIGGRLHELGCGFNPKAPRYTRFIRRARTRPARYTSAAMRRRRAPISSAPSPTGRSRTSTWTSSAST